MKPIGSRMGSSEAKTVFVIYYSMYGHVDKLSREICKGLEKAGGNEFSKLNSKVTRPSGNQKSFWIFPS